MGIRERHERDREAIRGLILDAARDLFVTEGYQNVSIRKIAERVEYSPAAIYGYFPSKDDIFFALAEDGFRLLHGRVLTLDGLPPIERIRRIFWRLYQFSCEQPQYFALMFVDRSVPRISHSYELFSFALEMKEWVLAELRRAIEEGVFPASLPPIVALRMLTAPLLGVAVMRLSDRLPPGESADDLAADALDVALAGLQAGIVLRSKAVPCADSAPAGAAEKTGKDNASVS